MTTVRRDRRIALIVGGLLAVFGTLCSAVQVAGWTIGSAEHTSHQVIPGPVRELRVDAGQGDVTVVPALGEDITIDSRAEGSLRTPRLRTVVNGNNVEVTGGCPTIVFWHCGAEIVIHVPSGTAVNVEAASGDLSATGISADVRLVTNSGDVQAVGLSGDAYLRTSSGDVVGRELAGPAELRSSSGDVFATGLGTGAIRARTSSGDVALRFASIPTLADAETSSGDAMITVPRGPTEYHVMLETNSGDREFGVLQDDNSPHLLSARTSSGDAIANYDD